MEERVGEERLRQLSEVHLQSSSGHMDILPLPVWQAHRLIWTQTHSSVEVVHNRDERKLPQN